MDASGPVPDRPYLKSSEVAALFGVNHSTVFLWVRKGRLRPKRTLGGNFRFARDQVVALWEQHHGTAHQRESRGTPRFTVLCPVRLTLHTGEGDHDANAVVTDICASGVGLRITDNAASLPAVTGADNVVVDIRNTAHAVIRESVRGTLRHFAVLDNGDITMGIALD